MKGKDEMIYKNPMIRGMYPDPSVCCKDGVYYLVNSTFEYFPGVPIFTSTDLVNWSQIGNCLTRKSQLDLSNTDCSGGVFAPVIRYHEEKFYMITTCACRDSFKNFFVTAKNPAGEWSDPIFVDFHGIDPSFYWENGHTYIQYAGRGEIFQIEIDEETGDIIKGPILLTTGCGGRDAEGPHMWKKDGYYYLMLAEGGTREGHMETLMRGKNLWGPFEPSPYNPILTNRECAREPIQCVGHADWVIGPEGKDYLVALGTRSLRHQTLLGRETVLTPAKWTEDGWLVSETGHLPEQWEGNLANTQNLEKIFCIDMNQKTMPLQVVSPRDAYSECYKFEDGVLKIKGNKNALSDGNAASWMIRQSEFKFELEVDLKAEIISEIDEAGIVIRSSDDYHFSLFRTMRDGKQVIVLRKKVADLENEIVCALEEKQLEDQIRCRVKGNKQQYTFYCDEKKIGWSYTKHLTVQTAGTPNTGAMLGIFAAGEAKAEIGKFQYQI